jgi:hypothetical protein
MQAEILRAIEARTVAGELSCQDAHDLAAEYGLGPLALADLVNRETEVRFSRCQLGLFGYGPKAEGLSKIVLPATHVPDEIRAALEAEAVNGCIPCVTVWEIADRFKYPRLGIANIIEVMGLRVRPCQLGCF